MSANVDHRTTLDPFKYHYVNWLFLYYTIFYGCKFAIFIFYNNNVDIVIPSSLCTIVANTVV